MMAEHITAPLDSLLAQLSGHDLPRPEVLSAAVTSLEVALVMSGDSLAAQLSADGPQVQAELGR